MVRKLVSFAMILIVLLVAIFGLYLVLLHPMHHHGCPLMVSETICVSTIIGHVSLWQSMFASVLGVLILLLGFAVFVLRADRLVLAHERVRLRSHACIDELPTLFQELYSRGIHNRKEPYHF